MNDNLIDLDAHRSIAPRKRKPFINLPPVTLALLLLLVAVQFAMTCVAPETRFELVQTFGFVPAPWTGHAAFAPFLLVTPLTYMLLHGGWGHLAVNGLTLAAFGAGVERWLGRGRFLMLFIVCGIAGAFAQVLLAPGATEPVIGASGALSGLFAAVIVMLHRNRLLAGEAPRTLPVIALWIVITVASGLSGLPYGTDIAWAVHLGGFAAGFALIKAMRA